MVDTFRHIELGAAAHAQISPRMAAPKFIEKRQLVSGCGG
jgi:hypothetical protein